MSEWIATNIPKVEASSQLIETQQRVKQLQNQIEDLKQEEQKLKERIKHLNIQLGWTLDYIQLTKQGKDTSHLDKFREQLERAFYDPDTDEPENDQPNHSNDPDDQTPE